MIVETLLLKHWNILYALAIGREWVKYFCLEIEQIKTKESEKKKLKNKHKMITPAARWLCDG